MRNTKASNQPSICTSVFINGEALAFVDSDYPPMPCCCSNKSRCSVPEILHSPARGYSPRTSTTNFLSSVQAGPARTSGTLGKAARCCRPYKSAADSSTSLSNGRTRVVVVLMFRSRGTLRSCHDCPGCDRHVMDVSRLQSPTFRVTNTEIPASPPIWQKTRPRSSPRGEASRASRLSRFVGFCYLRNVPDNSRGTGLVVFPTELQMNRPDLDNSLLCNTLAPSRRDLSHGMSRKWLVARVSRARVLDTIDLLAIFFGIQTSERTHTGKFFRSWPVATLGMCFLRLLSTTFLLRIFCLITSIASPATAFHHLSGDPLYWVNARNSDLPLRIMNNCEDDIYPAIQTQSGTGPSYTGFYLASGHTNAQSVSADWAGRVWARTNCSFNNAGSAPANGVPGSACTTGDCGGTVSCSGAVSPLCF